MFYTICKFILSKTNFTQQKKNAYLLLNTKKTRMGINLFKNVDVKKKRLTTKLKTKKADY